MSRPSAASTSTENVESTNDDIKRARELVERWRDQNAESIAATGCQNFTAQMTERTLNQAETGELSQNA